MLILLSILILGMVLDLMDVQLFHCQMGMDLVENIIIFVFDNSSSIHTVNRKKDIFILGKCPADGLDNATSTAETKYAINFSRQQNKFCLNFVYDTI